MRDLLSEEARFATRAGLPLFAVALAMLVDRAEPGAPPTRWGLLALALALVALWAAATERGRLLAVPALLALACVAAQDFFRPGITRGHDLSPHLWALWTLWRSVLDGDFWPRWIHRLGLGMPFLQFYPPGAYVLAWPAQALGASPVQAAVFLVTFGQVATATSTWLTARWLGGSRGAAAVAACALVLAPYHLLDQNVRFALGETLAFPWWPPLLAGLYTLGAGRAHRGAVPMVVVAAAAMLLTHVLSALLGLLVGAAVFGWGLRAPGAPTQQRLRALALAGALAAGVTGGFWLPMVAEIDEIAVAGVVSDSMGALGLGVTEPLRRRVASRFGARKEAADDVDPADRMPIYFGVALLSLAVAGMAGRRPGAPTVADADPPASAEVTPLIRAFALLALLSLALAIRPLSELLALLSPLRSLQFPWRLLAPASALAALAAGLGIDALPTGRPRLAAVACALAALGLDAAPSLGSAERLPPYEGLATFDDGAVFPLHGIPRDRFVRVELLDLPPSDYAWDLALSRRPFSEYMTPGLRDRYGKRTVSPSRAVSARYGVGFRVRDGETEARSLTAQSLLAWTVSAESGPAASWDFVDWTLTRGPEWLRIELPPGLPSGRLRVAEMAFPGWRARVDGGAWGPAGASEDLLAVVVPAGARSVELAFSALHPWDRAAGLGISTLTGLGLFGGWVARRRRG